MCISTACWDLSQRRQLTSMHSASIGSRYLLLMWSLTTACEPVTLLPDGFVYRCSHGQPVFPQMCVLFTCTGLPFAAYIKNVQLCMQEVLQFSTHCSGYLQLCIHYSGSGKLCMHCSWFLWLCILCLRCVQFCIHSVGPVQKCIHVCGHVQQWVHCSANVHVHLCVNSKIFFTITAVLPHRLQFLYWTCQCSYHHPKGHVIHGPKKDTLLQIFSWIKKDSIV